jgi:SpoVK/Ycf46/Vps4 family AAA+-type ATPase
MNTDYELQACFKESDGFENDYTHTPGRMDGVSLAIRLQQMRSHLTRAVLPPIRQRVWNKKSKEWEYQILKSSGVSNAILYGPPGTGKTTQAEALATTAKVPLVRLSPSDLMVQGTDVIESRARAIFESLSILTHAVIVLDEFEPVVRTRSKPKGCIESEFKKLTTTGDNHLRGESKSQNESSEEEERAPDPPEFRFLVTGMLPKLAKLNKAASAQSLVYMLATNHLIQIDAAAKRPGRFDLHLPIYNPDPISRLLALSNNLIEHGKQKIDKDKNDSKGKPVLERKQTTSWADWLREKTAAEDFWQRVKVAIFETANVSAQSLAKDFFSNQGGEEGILGIPPKNRGGMSRSNSRFFKNNSRKNPGRMRYKNTARRMGELLGTQRR